MYTQYLSRKIKRHLSQAAVLISITLLLFLLILNTDYSPDLYFINLEPYEDVSCHYERDGDALQSIDDRFYPSPNSIFFHETSCTGRLNSRQTCAIESASRTHPDWEIHVLFSSPVSKLGLGDIDMDLLKLMKNVYVWRVHLVDYAKGTPLEELVDGGALNRTRWPVSHTSDVLRFLTLYKWGGVYLDLDVMVLKPLEGLGRNWAARENDLFVASGALAISTDPVGTFVTNAAVRKLAKTFRGDVWGQNGPGLMTNVMKEICSTDDITLLNADKCLGFQVYPPNYLSPLGPERLQEFFEPGPLNISEDSYLYHMWNKQTHNLKVDKNAPYAKLAKRYCPIVYETYKDIFGI